MFSRGAVPLVSACETLFVKLGSRNQASCCIKAFLLVWYSTWNHGGVSQIYGTGNFNLSSLDMESKAVQKFMATMTSMDLSEIIWSPNYSGSYMFRSAFLSQGSDDVIWNWGVLPSIPCHDQTLSIDLGVLCSCALLHGGRIYLISQPQTPNNHCWVLQGSWCCFCLT